MEAQEFYEIFSVSNGLWKEDIVGESFYLSFIEPANGIEGVYMLSDSKQVRVKEGTFRIEIQEPKAFIYIDNERYLITFGDSAQEIILRDEDVTRQLVQVRP